MAVLGPVRQRQHPRDRRSARERIGWDQRRHRADEPERLWADADLAKLPAEDALDCALHPPGSSGPWSFGDGRTRAVLRGPRPPGRLAAVDSARLLRPRGGRNGAAASLRPLCRLVLSGPRANSVIERCRASQVEQSGCGAGRRRCRYGHASVSRDASRAPNATAAACSSRAAAARTASSGVCGGGPPCYPFNGTRSPRRRSSSPRRRRRSRRASAPCGSSGT
jgi:hypothetical protein